jgi:hypothetical protein
LQIRACKTFGISKLRFWGLDKILTVNDLLAKYYIQRT